MKRVHFLTFLIFALYSANAQEPRPDWARQTPFPPKGANFILVYGMGTAETEQQAEFLAWKNAFFKAFNEGGLVGFTKQAQSLDGLYSMNDLETVIPANVLPRHLVCQTLPIYISDKKIKIYVLLQVQRDGSIPPDFYDYGQLVDCETKDFTNRVQEWNKSEYKRQKKVAAEIGKETSAFFAKGHNNYMGLNLIDASPVPFSIGMSFIGRHLGKVGVGYEFNLGYATNTIAQTITYSAKIRFYLFENFFIQSGYGALGIRSIIDKKEYSFEYFGTDSMTAEETAEVLSNNYIIYGIPAQIGYDLLADGGGGFFMSFRGGVGYDMVMKRIIPQINVGLGLRF